MDFRTSLHIDTDSLICAHVDNYQPESSESSVFQSNSDSKFEKPRGLLESLSDFFTGTKFGKDVRLYYDSLQRSDIYEQLTLTKHELNSLKDQLSKVDTQELILRQRQSDLGAYLKDLASSIIPRNPTVEELINTEADRLALLEHRLHILKTKYMAQLIELEKFIRLNEPPEQKITISSQEEIHIFHSICKPTKIILPEDRENKT